MSDLKICRICVRTEAKMYHINQYQLHLYYEEVMNIKREELDGLPLHLCYECATILYKFHKFKQKCFMGLKVLNNILRDGPITYESVNKIDRKDTLLNSTLAMIPVNGNFKTYIITEKTKQIQENIENIDLDCKSESSFSDRDEIQEIVEDIKTNSEDEKMEIDEENKANTASIVSPTVVYIEDENGATKTDSNKDVIGNSKKGKGKIYETLHALDDTSIWKKSILSEEDAMKEFRAKADDKKYLAAAFKCKDCFKGFSKKNMLDRHIQLRHVEELGSIVCHFCRHRFKLECYLTKHIKQHYTRYECLRCNVIYSLENSAVLHEEYHSGATRKCNYCGEEFRHASTYYSHLRSHRSEHVCALCGASFVSALGLRQHKTIKHVIMDIESPDDDEEVNTYCEKCSIRFDTRKAYEEHLFHSALHGDDDLFKNNDSKPDSCDEKTDEESSDAHEKVSKSKKVLAKKEQAKITKIIKKRSVEHPIDVIAAAEGRKRFKKKTPRRRRRKPTTCHQCGKHFDTQAACMKHHINAHPRTSFHSPYERYICEICGASLAPGSIAVHQNIHTREKLHTCDTCGRQFHASVGLKRHMLTHTGEKPFGCPLCEKKFTQNNSMKLHYRTFHLKQPYPKRNRRPKKDEPKETVEARKSSEESSSSFDSLPDVQSRDQSGIDPVTGAVTSKPDDTINYLIN